MLKITLDPGHVRGANVGVANGYREGTAMFYYAETLKKALEKYEGIEVFVTRKSVDDDPALDARGKMAVNTGSEVFLSLHSDASSKATTRGVTVIRSLKRPDSVTLGKLLANAVNGVLGCGKSPYAGNDGGVWTRAYPGYTNLDYYGVIRSAVTGAGVKYAYLIEHSFHTNPTDCAQLDSSEVRTRLAEAEAKAIAAYFGLVKKHENVTVQALAQEEITMEIGPASDGDRAVLRTLADSLCLGYEEDETGRMRIGPASAGDQRAVLTKAAALGLAYGVYEPAPKPVPSTAPASVYIVQAGAFKNKANAESYAAELKRKGVDCIVRKL